MWRWAGSRSSTRCVLGCAASESAALRRRQVLPRARAHVAEALRSGVGLSFALDNVGALAGARGSRLRASSTPCPSLTA